MTKKFLIPAFILLFGLELVAMRPVQQKVDVYYFHFTRRCKTCNNVEKISRETVEARFGELVKKGEVSFHSINLDEKEGKAIGKKVQAEGQSLLIISGNERVDLTDKAFMWANNHPDKLEEAIKEAIDGFLQ